MLHDRITLANTISTLEDDAQDDSYTTTTIDDNVLPVGAEEMGAGMLQSIFGYYKLGRGHAWRTLAIGCGSFHSLNVRFAQKRQRVKIFLQYGPKQALILALGLKTWKGGSVAEWSARRTCNPVVWGSSPGLTTTWICLTEAPSSNPRSRL